MSALNYVHIILPVFGLGINVICQICICRYIKKIGLFNSLLISFLLGILGVLFIELYCLKQRLSVAEYLPGFFVNIITYSALSYCYFHFVNLGETGRRIRILRELYEAKNGLSLEEILSLYNARDVLKIRLARLLGNGQIMLRNGRYYIHRPIMLLMARAIMVMQLILMGKKIGV